jgi:L-rhamnose mutarotase
MKPQDDEFRRMVSMSFLLGTAAGAVATAVAGWLLTTRRRSAKMCAGVIKLKPELKDQYLALHDHTWEEVMAVMYEHNMRDFTVWLHEESGLMFHHYVYIGDDFEADMAAVGDDRIVRFWWTFCEPCQEPFHWKGPPPSQGGTGDPAHPGEWWAPMKKVNHCGGWSTSWSACFPDPDFEANHPHCLTTNKDNPPRVHNRTGDAAGWVSYTQRPHIAKQ